MKSNYNSFLWDFYFETSVSYLGDSLLVRRHEKERRISFSSAMAVYARYVKNLHFVYLIIFWLLKMADTEVNRRYFKIVFWCLLIRRPSLN